MDDWRPELFLDRVCGHLQLVDLQHLRQVCKALRHAVDEVQANTWLTVTR